MSNKTIEKFSKYLEKNLYCVPFKTNEDDKELYAWFKMDKKPIIKSIHFHDKYMPDGVYRCLIATLKDNKNIEIISISDNECFFELEQTYDYRVFISHNNNYNALSIFEVKSIF